MARIRNLWEELDATAAAATGKRIFYFLRDEEGGSNLPGGRKSLAFLTAGARRTDQRDERGRRLARLLVFPPSGAAPFAVVAPADPARTPGTWDAIKTADLLD